MKNFFHPTSLKIKITLILIVYLWIGSVYLASYNTTRNKDNYNELGVWGKTMIIMTFPSVFHILALDYINNKMVSNKIFTEGITLRELYTESGMINGPPKNDAFDTPITKLTRFGSMFGLIVEIFFLYCFACFFSLLKNYQRNRV